MTARRSLLVDELAARVALAERWERVIGDAGGAVWPGLVLARFLDAPRGLSAAEVLAHAVRALTGDGLLRFLPTEAQGPPPPSPRAARKSQRGRA